MEYNMHLRLINLADSLPAKEENKELKKALHDIGEDVRLLTWRYEELENKYQKLKRQRRI